MLSQPFKLTALQLIHEQPGHYSSSCPNGDKSFRAGATGGGGGGGGGGGAAGNCYKCGQVGLLAKSCHAVHFLFSFGTHLGSRATTQAPVAAAQRPRTAVAADRWAVVAAQLDAVARAVVLVVVVVAAALDGELKA
jgi:hypothetical protein